MTAQRFLSACVFNAAGGGAPAIGAVGTAGHGVVYATLNKKSQPIKRRFVHGAFNHSVYCFLISSHL
jgi:hypothetical protein